MFLGTERFYGAVLAVITGASRQNLTDLPAVGAGVHKHSAAHTAGDTESKLHPTKTCLTGRIGAGVQRCPRTGIQDIPLYPDTAKPRRGDHATAKTRIVKEKIASPSDNHSTDIPLGCLCHHSTEGLLRDRLNIYVGRTADAECGVVAHSLIFPDKDLIVSVLYCADEIPHRFTHTILLQASIR